MYSWDAPVVAVVSYLIRVGSRMTEYPIILNRFFQARQKLVLQALALRVL